MAPSLLAKYKKATVPVSIKTPTSSVKGPRDKFVEAVQEQLEIFRCDKEGVPYTKQGMGYAVSTDTETGAVTKTRTSKELRFRRWWAIVNKKVFIEIRYGQRLLINDVFELDSFDVVETFLKDLISVAQCGEFDEEFKKFKRQDKNENETGTKPTPKEEPKKKQIHSSK